MLLATVVIDPPIVAAAGVLFAIVTARAIAAGLPLKRTVLPGAFLGAWLGASFGMHAFKYPAWMLCYLIDPRALPTAVWYPPFVGTLVICGAFGAYYGHVLIASGRRRAAIQLCLGLVGLWIALFALTLQRYLKIGTFDEWRAGKALALDAQPAVIHDFNLATAVTAVGPLALIALAVLRNRRQPAAGPALRT